MIWKGYSVLEVIKNFNLINKKIKYKFAKEETFISSLLNRKITKILKWRPKISNQKILSSSLKWERKISKL